MHCIEQMSLRDALCCSVLQGVVVSQATGFGNALQGVAVRCRMHSIEQTSLIVLQCDLWIIDT